MSTKKFIISIASALAVLIVLSGFTVLFVGAKTHRSAILGTWVDENNEDLISVSITFNQDDTYKKTTTTVSAELPIPEVKTEEGTFSIFNGKIKLTQENGEKEVLTYKYNSEMHELEVSGYIKTNY